MKSSRIDRVTHLICQRGCQYVNLILNDKKAQQDCSELLNLSGNEKEVVIQELKSVMSVYDQSGNCSL